MLRYAIKREKTGSIRAVLFVPGDLVCQKSLRCREEQNMAHVVKPFGLESFLSSVTFVFEVIG
jgi:hypothetical protein